MNPKLDVRATAGWLAAGVGVAAAAYGAYVGITWYDGGELVVEGERKRENEAKRESTALMADAREVPSPAANDRRGET